MGLLDGVRVGIHVVVLVVTGTRPRAVGVVPAAATGGVLVVDHRVGVVGGRVLVGIDFHHLWRTFSAEILWYIKN